jgi:hypothetical protein
LRHSLEGNAQATLTGEVIAGPVFPLPRSPLCDAEEGESEDRDEGISDFVPSPLDEEMERELDELLSELRAEAREHGEGQLEGGLAVSTAPLPPSAGGQLHVLCDAPMEPAEEDERAASPGIERTRAHFRNPYEEGEDAETPGASSSAAPAAAAPELLDSCNTAGGKLNLLIVPKYALTLEAPIAADLPHLEICTTHANRRWVFAICSMHEAGGCVPGSPKP